MSEQKLKLKSADGDIFDVERAVLNRFTTIKTMLEDIDVDFETAIPVSNVSSLILKKVIQWADHHKNDPIPVDEYVDDNKNGSNLSEWDQEFLKVDQGTLFEMLLAVNYLDMKDLVDAVCKTVANMMKGKSSEEIRRIFNIKNDFTPQEEEQIKKENEWCEEK